MNYFYIHVRCSSNEAKFQTSLSMKATKLLWPKALLTAKCGRDTECYSITQLYLLDEYSCSCSFVSGVFVCLRGRSTGEAVRRPPQLHVMKTLSSPPPRTSRGRDRARDQQDEAHKEKHALDEHSNGADTRTLPRRRDGLVQRYESHCAHNTNT